METSKRCCPDSNEEPRKKAKSSDYGVNLTKSLSPHTTNSTMETRKRFVFKKPSKISDMNQTVIPTTMYNFNGHQDNSTSDRTHTQKTKHTVCEKLEELSPSNTSCRRQFPGPAGLLPVQIKDASTSDLKNQNSLSKVDEQCSQGTLLKFTSGPWEQMLSDYQDVSDRVNLPEKYNIQWIKSGVLAKELHNQRTPFLAAFIHSINCNTSPNAVVNIVLKDKSGTIEGTILPKLYEQYSNELIVGSVLVLKQTGVLNAGSSTEPYLIITQNNLISIYTNRSETSNLRNFQKCSKIVLREISLDDIYKSIDEMNCDKQKTIANSLRCFNFNKKDSFRKPNKGNFQSSKSLSSNEPSDGDDKIEELMIEMLEQSENSYCNVNNEHTNVSTELAKDTNCNGAAKTTNKKWNFNSTTSPGLDKTKENHQILQDMFEGLDTNLLFEDF